MTKPTLASSLLLLLFSLILSTSCSKEESDESAKQDEYYVKYKVRNSSTYIGGTVYADYRNEDDKGVIVTMSYNEQREFIIGPVSKGFECRVSMSAGSTTHDKLSLYSNISVSKNGSPFALKASDETGNPRDNSDLYYTIDY